jgi:RNA 3'-terminal phosphate cyclase (ATP)
MISAPIEIEGTHGEGGGQILRVALALSAVTRKPVHVARVRGKRSPPGLRPQHRTSVEALTRFVEGEAKGGYVGSTDVVFCPRSPRPGRLVADIGTAGSTTLILQSLLPVMLFSGRASEAEIYGGTDNPLAPPVDYVDRVLFPMLARMGARAELRLKRRGFYPKGGGSLEVQTESIRSLDPIELVEAGEVMSVGGVAYSSRLSGHIVPRMINSAVSLLESERIPNSGIEQEILQRDDPRCAFSPGVGMVLTSKLSSGAIVGSDELGRIGRTSEDVGRSVASSLIHLIQGKIPVDEHLGDQLLIYMALARGHSTIRVAEVTTHMVSCIYVCERFLGRIFTLGQETGGATTISCNGVGLAAR